MKPFLVKTISGLYYRTIRLFSWVGSYQKCLFNFILPNLNKIIQKKVTITGADKVTIGEKCSFGYKLGGNFYRGLIEIQPRYEKSRIIIGNNVLTNNNLFFCAANYIETGDETLIGQYVTIMDHEAHGVAPDKRREVGDNTIVATGAVVAGNFPENVIIGGAPAKIIKML